jgi:hypothetical protein
MKILNVTLFILLMLNFSSCLRNPLDVNTRGIKVNVHIQRFDRELFKINTDSIPIAIEYLYSNYTDFLEVFSYHIIAIGLPSEKTYQSYLGMFINDRLNKEVFNETQKVFPDLIKEEATLSEAFKRYKFHFPDNKIPVVVSFVSRFNNSCFTVGDYLGIGLDMYLGVSSPYYKKLDLPQYQKVNMYREKIPSDLIFAWASEIFPYNDSVNNVLSHIIHQGKLMYFLEAMLPSQSDELLTGFTGKQLKWIHNNEEMMWIYLIENKLLFSENQMDIRKLTGPAPFTYFFTSESPGRAGIWIGWQIVREYSKRNPHLSLKQIMEEKDYEKILRLSKYNP